MILSDAFSFLNLRDKISNKKLSIQTMYKFSRFFNQLEQEIKFFNETLEAIIKEYGQKDENGEFIYTADKQGIKIREDKFNECTAKINELNNLEVHLEYKPEFTLEELENLDLNLTDMNILIPYIKEN